MLGVGALLLNYLFGKFNGLYDVLYYKGIFQAMRYVYDYTLGLIPIPMVYILFFVVVQIIYKVISMKGIKQCVSIPSKIGFVLLRLLSFVGGVIFFFYFLWGFNYKQTHLSDQLSLPEVSPDSTLLYERSMAVLDQMTTIRKRLSTDTIPLSKAYIPDDLEKSLRKGLVTSLDSWDLPTGGRVRVRSLAPKGILLRISTAGVYIPFVFEGHIDAGLHPIQVPFTMAHEMSHGYGLADEGTCNFTGFIACMQSDNDFVRYSAYMSFWRYMASNLSRSSKSLYKDMVRSMDKNVRRDLIAILDEMDKYPDILPEVRDKVYDTYLKSHGVAGGLSNYSKIVEMVFAWYESEHNEEMKGEVF